MSLTFCRSRILANLCSCDAMALKLPTPKFAWQNGQSGLLSPVARTRSTSQQLRCLSGCIGTRNISLWLHHSTGPSCAASPWMAWQVWRRLTRSHGTLSSRSNWDCTTENGKSCHTWSHEVMNWNVQNIGSNDQYISVYVYCINKWLQ